MIIDTGTWEIPEREYVTSELSNIRVNPYPVEEKMIVLERQCGNCWLHSVGIDLSVRHDVEVKSLLKGRGYALKKRTLDEWCAQMQRKLWGQVMLGVAVEIQEESHPFLSLKQKDTKFVISAF